MFFRMKRNSLRLFGEACKSRKKYESIFISYIVLTCVRVCEYNACDPYKNLVKFTFSLARIRSSQRDKIAEHSNRNSMESQKSF